MQVSLDSLILDFVPVRLQFKDCSTTNVFAKKNNKTVATTLIHPKYSRLAPTVLECYPAALQQNLGEFLHELKVTGDPFYRKFLNRYGDDTYCDFSIEDPVVRKQRGLYCFVVDQRIKYIGKSTDTFGKRINQGYGRIHPKNCYLDGQATNCHLNALIASNRDRAKFFVCPLTDVGDREIRKSACSTGKTRVEHSVDMDESLISDLRFKRPHVFILGAGASRAALPNGDRNGRRLPLMNDLVDVVGLQPLLDRYGVRYQGDSFETLYSDLHDSCGHSELLSDVEGAVFDYFASLELPDDATIYD